MAKAVFLDRDGTLNPDPGYIADPDLMTIYPWVAPALRRLKDRGFLLFVVSNQSGVGRGLITPEQLIAVNDRLQTLLETDSGIKIDDFANCPHRPDQNCHCRKPKPGLIEQLVKQYPVDLKQSFLIGDRDTDQMAGQSAGCLQSFKIETGDRVTFEMAVESILKTELK
jgi:histidinol-phosphate phosphatase family protein